MNALIKELESHPIWSNTYGLARSILALGTLLTLLANDTSILFKSATIDSSHCDALEISLYCLAGNIELGRWISVALLIPVVIGWRPMFTGVFHWWVTYSLVNSATIIDGGDHIASIVSLLLIPVTLTDTRKWHWAVDRMERRESLWFPVRALIPVSCFIAIKIQIAIIYLNSASAKLSVKEWVDGTAIYYWFTHPVFGSPQWLSFAVEPIIFNGAILFVITWGVIILEFILFAGLFMGAQHKKWLLPLGLAFHFCIFIIHGLASFFITMAACLILYLRPVHLNIAYPKLFPKLQSL
jgi:antimicrobial peptide system SdpB family protein